MAEALWPCGDATRACAQGLQAALSSQGAQLLKVQSQAMTIKARSPLHRPRHGRVETAPASSRWVVAPNERVGAPQDTLGRLRKSLRVGEHDWTRPDKSTFHRAATPP